MKKICLMRKLTDFWKFSASFKMKKINKTNNHILFEAREEPLTQAISDLKEQSLFLTVVDLIVKKIIIDEYLRHYEKWHVQFALRKREPKSYFMLATPLFLLFWDFLCIQ